MLRKWNRKSWNRPEDHQHHAAVLTTMRSESGERFLRLESSLKLRRITID